MTPTNKLRWLKVQHKDKPYADMTLQQWWETSSMGTINLGWTDEMLIGEVKGEWRDVKVEE